MNDQPVTDAITYTTQLTRDGYPCSSAGFEPTISAIKRPQTYASDCTATRISHQPLEHMVER